LVYFAIILISIILLHLVFIISEKASVVVAYYYSVLGLTFLSKIYLSRININEIPKGYNFWYYFTKGIINQKQKKYAEAIVEYEKTLLFNESTSNDLSIIHIALSQCNYMIEDYSNALYEINNAENISHKEKLNHGINNLKEQIQEKIAES